MKMQVWKSVEGLTDRWHDDAGLVVVSDRTPKVVLIESLLNESVLVREALGPVYEKLDLSNPDLVLETDSTEEHLYIFPDAGCC